MRIIGNYRYISTSYVPLLTAIGAVSASSTQAAG
jgi:hypothetical protein